jgi:hypothetical protein
MGNIKGKPFTDVLGEVENGELLKELTEEVYNIVAAVMETRKKGSLKISMTFTPTGKAVAIDGDWDSNIPEHDRQSTTFFVLPDLTLVRNDPDQPKLPLREVGVPSVPPREVVG